MARQFVACIFREGDTRTYTYHWDGEPLAKGAEVKVARRKGEGWNRVIVQSVSPIAPPYETKPILGMADEPDAPAPPKAGELPL